MVSIDLSLLCEDKEETNEEAQPQEMYSPRRAYKKEQIAIAQTS